MAVDVVNLETGKTVATYTFSPKEAVKVAYVQFVLNDWNTFNYDDPKLAAKIPKLCIGKHTVSCGDFCALLNRD
jgi:hypothetical protein